MKKALAFFDKGGNTMKKLTAFLALLLCSASLIAAQDTELRIKDALDNLSARTRRPVEVSVGPVTIAGTNTPAALSRYLADKITLFAANNPGFKVVRPTRGVKRAAADGTLKGKITGTYTLRGNSVDVTLDLIDETDNAVLSTTRFSIPLSEMEAMGIALFPANDKTEMEALRPVVSSASTTL